MVAVQRLAHHPRRLVNRDAVVDDSHLENRPILSTRSGVGCMGGLGRDSCDDTWSGNSALAEWEGCLLEPLFCALLIQAEFRCHRLDG